MSKTLALKIIFLILSPLLILHLLIFSEQIPYDKVWAGKLNSVDEMKRFETFSIVLNLFIIVILAIKYWLLKNERVHKIVDGLIWGFCFFFALNTIGNLFSKSMLELILGTMVTLTLSILCFFVVKKDKKHCVKVNN